MMMMMMSEMVVNVNRMCLRERCCQGWKSVVNCKEDA